MTRSVTDWGGVPVMARATLPRHASSKKAEGKTGDISSSA